LHGLEENWFNNGPVDVKKYLPPFWHKRLVNLFKGKALTLLTLHKSDLIKTKSWAYCERSGDDRDDILSLNPSIEELEEAMEWLKPLDANVDWPKWVQKKMAKLVKIIKEKNGTL
jgi:hypothetical protein